jgi:HEAT repeat protein
VCAKAAESLRAMNPATANELLVRDLGSPSYRVKAEAARLLGERRYQPAIEQLADIAASPLEAVEVQAASRAALRAMKDLVDQSKIANDARNPEQEKAQRTRALTMLSAIGGPDSLQACLDVLGDEDQSMRGSAAQALAEMGNPRALPALREAEKNATNERVAKVIANAIRKLERSGAP